MVGIVPERTSDPDEAFALMRRDGVAILTGLGVSPDDARGVAQCVLRSLEPVVPEPVGIKEIGGSPADGRPYGEEIPGLTGSTTRVPFLTGHNDGFAYGDQLPDFIFMLWARSAGAGGESLMVDTYALLEELARSADPADAELLAFLANEPIEQSEPGFYPSIAPVIMPTPSGRRLVRMTIVGPVQRPRPELAEAEGERQRALLARWRALCHAASVAAPKFVVGPGEAVCLDNYRMLHGRTGFDDPERMLWRVWAWTPEAIGVPDGMLASDSRHAAVH